jgi:O-antigen ligase
MAKNFNHVRKQFISQTHLGWVVLIVVSVLFAVASMFVSPIFFMGIAAIVVGLVILVRWPFLGLILYLITFVLRPGEMWPALAPLALERIIGLGVLITGMFLHKRRYGTISLPSALPFKLMLVFEVVIIASLVVSLDESATLDAIEFFAKLIVFYLLIHYTIDTRLKFDIFVAVFVLLILREAALSFTDYYGGGAIYRMGIMRATGRGSFGSGANSLAATLVFAMPFMVTMWKNYRNGFIRVAVAGGLFLLILMTINTGSRGGLLAMLTVTGATVFHTRYRLITTVVAVGILVGGWFLLPDQYKGRYATLVSDEDANDISTGRVEIWENGMRMFSEHPVLGIGSGAFIAANSSGDYGPPIELNPHSIYVQLLAEVGLIGFVVWFTFLFSYLRLLFKRSTPRRGPPGSERLIGWLNAYKEGFMGSTLALLVAGATAHSLMRFNWYMYAALAVVMTTLFWKEYSALEKKETETETVETQAESSLVTEN